jgi:hypothetical protein
MSREAAEKKRENELVELRKKYLAKKGKKPAAKKKAIKPKLVGREAVEAKRQEKLEALRVAAKTRKALKNNKKSLAPKKSVKPKSRPSLSISKTTVTSSLIPKTKKFKNDIAKLKKDISSSKGKNKSPITLSKYGLFMKELARLEKEYKQRMMKEKRKQRSGKKESYVLSGAGDDIDFLVKMLKK